MFRGINRNKLSVTLNLKADESRQLARKLIVGSDVVKNNYLAYAPIIQVRSGLMSQVGYSGDEESVGELQAPRSDGVAAMAWR